MNTFQHASAKTRTRFTSWISIGLWMVGIMTSVMQPIALGQTPMGYRIDTDLYVDNSAKPTATVRTLFHNSRYIEINESTHRTTVFEPMENRIIIIDDARSLRTEIDMRLISARLDQAEAAMDSQKRMAFSSQEEPTADNEGFLAMKNAFVRYRFKPQTPSNPDIAISYADYADWSVRLNALFPPKQAPQLRMQINRLLVEAGQLPQEIRRSPVDAKTKSNELVAILLIKETLGEEDRQWLSRIDGWLRSAALVADDVFFDEKASVSQRKSGSNR